MTHVFPDETVAAVLRHMNADHLDDNLLIVTGIAGAAAVSARMLSFDGEGGDWEATVADGAVAAVRIPWPGGPIDERAAVRREIVALYDEACHRLGVEPRPH